MESGRGPSFGERLRRLRQAAGWSQEELAERAGLTAAAIGTLERGERRHPYPQTLQALAGALGLGPEERAALFTSVPRRGGAASGGIDAVAEVTTLAGSGLASLPPQPTPLVGREGDLGRVCERVLEPGLRLLTLTGPGGTGKTRLAVAAAAGLASSFPDGVVFVDLSLLSDPQLVLPTVGRSVGVTEAGRQETLPALERKLRSRTVLLVLDNFEHLAAAATELDQLLEGCPAVKVLATSRVPLHVRREQEYPVPPLDVPRPDGPWTVDELTANPAVALFVGRAGAAYAGFRLEDENMAAIATLCRRLDGLPLALELAAARMKLLPPQELLARLESRLDLLASELRDAPARHQTLRAAIDWSLSLLADEERTLFRRLAAFAGGWTLEAAEAVGERPGEGIDVVVRLASLVDQSLVQRVDEAAAETARYRLLETVRARALEELTASGELEEVRRRHAEYFVAFVEAVGDELFATRPAVLRLVSRELANLRATLGWLVERGERALALRLSTSLYPYWLFSGETGEGQRWLEAILALPPEEDEPPAARARALSGRAGLLLRAGDVEAGLRHARVAVAAAVQAGDPRALGHAHFVEGMAAFGRGDDRAAAEHLAAAREVTRTSGDPYWEAIGLPILALTEERAGRFDPARAAFERGAALFGSSGNLWGLARVLSYQASFELRRGEPARARELAREALARHQDLGSVWMEGECFATLAEVLAGEGRDETAAWLAGVAAALGESYPTPPAFGAVPDRALTAARSRLGEAAFGEAWQAGHRLSLGDGIAFALAASEPMAAR